MKNNNESLIRAAIADKLNTNNLGGKGKMAISVLEAIDNGLLDVELAEIIPTHCEECGSELMLTESLKQIYCDNRTCPTKVASRLEGMAKMMKADGWGESTCLQVVKSFGMVSPFQVFLLQGRECPSVAAFDKKLAEICDANKRIIKLWEVVKYANIPSIDTVAFKIFDGYNSMEEAFDDIEEYGVALIAEKLGLRNAETGIMAVNIYSTLMEYKDELLFGESTFEVYNPSGEKLYMAITGGVYGYANKSEFVSYINQRYAGKVNAMLMNSVTREVDVLISDGGANSNKVKKAKKIQEDGGKIKIMDSQELIQYLDEKYNS